MAEGKIIAVVRVRSGARVRLTSRQWEHIVTARPELGGFKREVLETIERPDGLFEPPLRLSLSCTLLRGLSVWLMLG